MGAILFSFPGNEAIANALSHSLSIPQGEFTLRHFPDGESYLRIESSVENKDVILVATLERPDDKLLPLLFMADTLRTLKAKRIGVVAPYLAYMRQDVAFHPGEAVSSRAFATLLSRYFDWLVTIDPHLHRIHTLSELYSIPSYVGHAAGTIAQWIRTHVTRPVIIGPDSESEQWVSQVAKDAGAPWVVLEKIRRGDHEVELSLPNLETWKTYQPVLVDDIISTATTMVETIGHLKKLGLNAPTCIGVHAVFAADAFEKLKKAGATEIITCNTITHPSNRIDIVPILKEGITNLKTL